MKSFLPTLVAVLGLAGCTSTDDAGLDTQDTAAGQDVTLQFSARFDSAELACGQDYDGLGTTGTTGQIRDARLFIHGVELLTADGDAVPVTLDNDGLWQNGVVGLLDFEDATGQCSNGTTNTNAQLTGTVAPGEYVGVRFTVGVPFELNHQDPTVADSPLNLTSMHWSWQGGYKFLRLDLGTTGSSGWMLHVGSTGCTADADGVVTECSEPNRPEIELAMDPDADTIVMDFAALLAGTDLDADAGGAVGCMSAADDPECPALLSGLGIGDDSLLFSVE